ncbi:FAD-binding oxidoreductase [Microcoleus sp. FACHB-672]|uniref:FAD-binding oxidoreductase n=1 Tax=Microcoleus sp. FACHB-672 TaxID=2692825 RepID=UPI001681FA4A|nr:FAD-binding oxidoreductase [Microcoleus sp. FACHB-672]MBD2039526.1 FAD-binding oxidoreductase [Microcoleus sp. FACHB-672]
MVNQSAIAQQLEKILGSSGICSWANLEASRKEQIAQCLTPAAEIDCIVYPQTEAELAEVMACAHRQRWGVLPLGSGSKLNWGGLAAGVNLAVSTERLNKLVDHAAGDLTITAEAGMKFAELQQILASVGQFLALDPSYPEMATLGGIVATGDTGSLRQRYNGVRDQLIGFSFVRSDGQLAKAGGRVVKNVAGYDLMKLFTGSFGTLGVISQVTFRVYPLSLSSQTVLLTGEADAIATATQTLLASALTPTAADLLSAQLVNQLEVGAGMGLLVRFQSIAESVKQQSERVLEVGKTLGLQSTTFVEADEAALWQKLPEQMRSTPKNSEIICKIGVRPSEAVAVLTQLNLLFPNSSLSLIHAGSGLGLIRVAGENAITPLSKMRSICESSGGFLSVLVAPISLKQQLDVWGYTGNALDLMRRIKQQFDPENILSPERFVGKI